MIRARNSNLEIAREPEAGKQMVLCLPGTMLSPAIFEQIEAPDGYDLQLIPVSWMTSPGPWEITALAERLLMLIEELGVGPAYVAGHSTGGAIALAAAVRDSGSIPGLVLSNTGPNLRGHGDHEANVRAIAREWGPDLHARFLKRCFHYQPEDKLAKQLLAYMANTRREVAATVLESQGKLNLEPELGKIAVPAVIAHGRYDWARPVAHAELLARDIPCTELRLLDAGHTPTVEDKIGYEAALHRLCAMASRRSRSRSRPFCPMAGGSET